ncbi:MAG: N-acetylmuramoyl-L-alanine amidase family 2 [Parcubacteria group bacterium GW2011_GWA2_43_9b]|nr:MAG: N-acetylmuramoyl-L-alanine amidase family 2 [Parcubacteria group bacterium GW2011_GWA2_43_9b]
MERKILTKNIIWLFVFSLVLPNGLFFAKSTNAQNEGLVYGDSDVPVILPRASWDNTPALNALMTWAPDKNASPSDYQPVERIILHDTGCDASNPTCNNNQNPVATIQAMYRYHAVTRGWGDIGYNYIIDQQGRIYEGRYGGNGSRGAHVFVDKTKDNFNFGTIGITVLGNYGKIQPAEAVYQSLIRLVAWLAATNNLDPQGTRSSSIWNFTTSEFSSLYNGPIVVGHKDVEKGNPDPGLLDVAKVRRATADFAAKYRNYIYQVDSLPKIYKIGSGTRQIYNDLPTYVSMGGVYRGSVIISQTQADLFSESRFLKYPDGSLLRIKDNFSVYLIQDGQKRNLNVSVKQFMVLGFDFDRVRVVEETDLAGYLETDMVKYGPDKQLLSDGQRVYLIQAGQKRWIPSDALFATLGYSWSKIKSAPTDLKNYLDGAVLSYPDGTLLQAAGQEAVYLVSGGQLSRFISAEIFLNLKYNWSKIKKIPAEELAYYPIGDFVKYKDGALLRPNDENNVYLISGGKPQLVDGATFKKKKYKWVNVLVISAQDFHILYRGAAIEQPISTQLSPSPSATPTPSLTPVPSPTPTIIPTPASSSSPISSSEPKMRVAVYEVTAPSVTLTANMPFNILDKTGQIVVGKAANENYVYNISASSTAFVRIVPQSTDGIVQIVSYEDHPAWKPSLNYNQFHGTMEIVYSAKSNKIWAVNELRLEDYLKGIAEINQTDSAEHQKTMIVASRTYAYYYILKGGKRGADEVYILNNTSADQLYKGYTRELSAPAVVDAVNFTRGEVAVYNGAPIVTAYSSGAPELATSGTKNACTVWGNQYCQAGFEYLAGEVKDPANAPYTQSVCGGGNHCVGLSAAGSRQFSLTGAKNYQEVLKYYYSGTEIKKIY